MQGNRLRREFRMTQNQFNMQRKQSAWTRNSKPTVDLRMIDRKREVIDK
jgi:hypothetical protein